MKMTKSVYLMVMGLVLCTLGDKLSAFQEQYTIYCDANAQDKWFGTHYIRDGRNDNMLKVGGWGDYYLSMIKMPVHFNVPGRKHLKAAYLNLYSHSSYMPTSMRKWFIVDSWNENSTSDHWSVGLIDRGVTSIPPGNGYFSINITSEFYTWLTNPSQNYGMMFGPENIDNKFNYFFSTENGDAYRRPSITLIFERIPFFKVPLPGGNYWRCNTAPGGYYTHTGKSYYSVDYGYWHLDGNMNLITTKTDIPILAAADGTVVDCGNTPSNGNFVIIDHDNDGKFETGYQTCYLHLKDNTLAVQKDQFVRCGQLLGIMGDTGSGVTGIHLHFQFYFEHQGSQISDGDNSDLNPVTIDGNPIIEYQEGAYYESGNSLWNF